MIHPTRGDMSHLPMLKLLFGDRPVFDVILGIQGHPIRHAFMATSVFYLERANGGKPIHILEIGSWIGSSAFTWGQALATCKNQGSITCVDPWTPYLGSRPGISETLSTMENALQADLPYQLFLHNMRFIPSDIKVRHLRGYSSDILPLLREEQFDLVYVDGDHAYDRVVEDLRLSMSLLKPGGILCGDDLESQGHECDRDFAWKNRNADLVTHPVTGASFHPGVTLAVYEVLGPVTALCGYWLTQKMDAGWQGVDLSRMPTIIPEHFPDAMKKTVEETLRRQGALV